VDVIVVTTHPLKLNLMAFADLASRFGDDLHHLFVRQRLPVLHRNTERWPRRRSITFGRGWRTLGYQAEKQSTFLS
jgi:hypothetical protein